MFLEEDIQDTCFKFGDDRFRGLASAEGQMLPFPIDFDGRPYNTLSHYRVSVWQMFINIIKKFYCNLVSYYNIIKFYFNLF